MERSMLRLQLIRRLRENLSRSAGKMRSSHKETASPQERVVFYRARNSAFAGLAVSGALVAAPRTHAAASFRGTLDLGGPIKIKVEEGVIDALIKQGGASRAGEGADLCVTGKCPTEVESERESLPLPSRAFRIELRMLFC